MRVPEADTRGPQRRALDEQIAAEVEAERLIPPPESIPLPVEAFMRSPSTAMVGIVENGVIRPLNPNFNLPERSRVIIVAMDRQ